MEGLEFYIYNDKLWCKTDTGVNEVVTEHSTEIVSQILDAVRERYPKAYEALEKVYGRSSMNTPYFQFLMARRFCKCNFGKLDSTKLDRQRDGSFNFEKVECPLRGECQYEGVICMPKFNSSLSDAELRVMQLVYDGLTKEQIAERLFLSPHTIKNHIKSVYAKLGIHDIGEFMRYANKNHLFE